MHLQQTKRGSRASGGPQYYFHDLSDPIKEFLRKRGACPVVLQTPYGLAKSSFMAVDKDHKITGKGKVVAGRVGHDRIQQGGGGQSIGEAIRYWYAITTGTDFERIDIDVELHHEGHFIIIPTKVSMTGRQRVLPLEKIHMPLSFHRDHQSKLWRQQIDAVRAEAPADVAWAATQINQVVADHGSQTDNRILESDLLRTAGALSVVGLQLSPYLGAGYDCLRSQFRFEKLKLPMYPCPVEIKKRSRGFTYQVTKYVKLPRAVVLCMEHNLVNPPSHIDVNELPALAKYLSA